MKIRSVLEPPLCACLMICIGARHWKHNIKVPTTAAMSKMTNGHGDGKGQSQEGRDQSPEFTTSPEFNTLQSACSAQTSDVHPHNISSSACAARHDVSEGESGSQIG